MGSVVQIENERGRQPRRPYFCVSRVVHNYMSTQATTKHPNAIDSGMNGNPKPCRQAFGQVRPHPQFQQPRRADGVAPRYRCFDPPVECHPGRGFDARRASKPVHCAMTIAIVAVLAGY
jgi:hypothetical protein